MTCTCTLVFQWAIKRSLYHNTAVGISFDALQKSTLTCPIVNFGKQFTHDNLTCKLDDFNRSGIKERDSPKIKQIGISEAAPTDYSTWRSSSFLLSHPLNPTNFAMHLNIERSQNNILQITAKTSQSGSHDAESTLPLHDCSHPCQDHSSQLRMLLSVSKEIQYNYTTKGNTSTVNHQTGEKNRNETTRTSTNPCSLRVGEAE